MTLPTQIISTGDDPEYAWPWLFWNRDANGNQQTTIADLRTLNRDSLLPWPLGLLLGIMDCGINPTLRPDAIVLARFRDTDTAIGTSIAIVDSGSLIGELLQRDDGDYVVLRRLRKPDSVESRNSDCP